MQSMTCKHIQNQTGIVVRKVSMHVHFSQSSLSDHSDTPPWVNNWFCREQRGVCQLFLMLCLIEVVGFVFDSWCENVFILYFLYRHSSSQRNPPLAGSVPNGPHLQRNISRVNGLAVFFLSMNSGNMSHQFHITHTHQALATGTGHASMRPWIWIYRAFQRKHIHNLIKAAKWKGKHIGVLCPHLHEIQHGAWIQPNTILGKSSATLLLECLKFWDRQLRWKWTSSAMINLAWPTSNDKHPLYYYSVVQFVQPIARSNPASNNTKHVHFCS